MQNDWIKCIRQEINDFKWLPSKNARICSDHFCNKDYKGYDGERKVMLKKAFPCFQKGHNDIVNRTGIITIIPITIPSRVNFILMLNKLDKLYFDRKFPKELKIDQKHR
ncbi:hypothetical protein HELRODRAFT_175210 [Helobdella robusta]|uniref:THAP-type domain-containing protein n=1 Tax=Helobdella robusta TaxID=6412 RepID=T1F906_HELRO|nr:hypothetical protein HELRODRAFT_175210 [Helobdella robusta]ESO01182.1 hypothetical protein HELRODRAFT_175210 [Helobdella robusta]